MGSAVSAVTGAIGGIVGGGVQSLTSAMTPQIQVADQTKLNDQIAALQANSGTYQGTSNQLMGQANNQLGTTQASLGQAQGAINNAQGVNQGGNVQNALGLLQAQANGTAPSAAEGVLQQGKDQAIATQAAMANSGNLSQMISGQKTAMDNAANLVQQSANQASQLRANQQATGQQAYAGAAGQQAAQAGNNAALEGNLAGINGNLYSNQVGAAGNFANLGNQATTNAGNLAAGGIGLVQGVGTQNAQNQVAATGGLLNGGGAAMGAMMSDEDTKTNIQSDRATRTKGVSDYFKSENKKPEATATPKAALNSYGDEDTNPQTKARKDIKAGFISDEKTKKDVKQDSMLHAFLDKVNPVTYEYKEPTGEMGKTPGTHMGIIAQDVEKAPGGESMIVETPKGKAIDMASAMGMLMSAAADAHDRVSSLEELFKSKKKR